MKNLSFDDYELSLMYLLVKRHREFVQNILNTEEITGEERNQMIEDLKPANRLFRILKDAVRGMPV